MDLTRKLELLDQQIADANGGHPSNFEAWKQKTEVVLRNVLGKESPILESFQDNRYHPSMWTENTDFAPYVRAGVQRAVSMLESAKVELELQHELAEAVEPAGGDPG